MAKLVRNHILATALQLPFPWISIDELVHLDKTRVEEILADTAFPLICQGFTLDPDLKSYQEAYLRDLLTQTRIPLIETLTRRDMQRLNEIRQRDSLYGSLSRVLYLSPAPFEEKEIDIWADDASVVMRGEKVPTAEALQSAARFFTAELTHTRRVTLQFRVTPYDDAIKAWKQYHENTIAQNERIGKLRDEIAEQKQLLGMLMKEQSLPEKYRAKAREQLRYTVAGARLDADHRKTNDSIKRAEDALEAYNILGTKTVEYLASLRKENGGNFPHSVELPDWITQEYQALRWHMENSRRYISAGIIKKPQIA